MARHMCEIDTLNDIIKAVDAINGAVIDAKGLKFSVHHCYGSIDELAKAITEMYYDEEGSDTWLHEYEMLYMRFVAPAGLKLAETTTKVAGFESQHSTIMMPLSRQEYVEINKIKREEALEGISKSISGVNFDTQLLMTTRNLAEDAKLSRMMYLGFAHELYSTDRSVIPIFQSHCQVGRAETHPNGKIKSVRDSGLRTELKRGKLEVATYETVMSLHDYVKFDRRAKLFKAEPTSRPLLKQVKRSIDLISMLKAIQACETREAAQPIVDSFAAVYDEAHEEAFGVTDG